MRTVVLLAAAVLALLAGSWWLLPGGEVVPAAQPGAPRATGAIPAVPEPALLAERGDRASARPQLAAPLSPEPAAEAFAPALRVGARVLGADERPLPGAQLALAHGAPLLVAHSDAAGRIELELSAVQLALLGAGPLVFHVRASRHALLRGERALTGAAALHLGDLRLAPGGTLAGRIEDESGRRLAGARVVATRARPMETQHVALRRAHGPREMRSNLLSAGDLHETHSAADGGFELLHLGLGHWTVWAQEGDRLWAWSAPVALDVRDATGVLVVLGPPEPGRWIRGRLLDPAGAPVREQRVSLLLLDERRRTGQEAISGEDGAFAFAVEPEGAYRLSAQPTVWEWTAAALEPVRPGARAVELRFGASRWMWIHARDAHGSPVAPGRALALHPVSGFPLPRAQADLWGDGRTILRVPEEPFLLRVEAPGFRAAQLGPLEPALVEAPLEVALERGPAIRGRVRDAHSPVPGASVSLQPAPPAGRSFVSSGWQGEGEAFVHSAGLGRIATAASGADGAFELAVPPRQDDGGLRALYLVAQAPGRASQHLGPLSVEPEQGLEDLELVLDSGGAVRGTLVLEGERPTEGWTVRASDGFGGLAEDAVGADGAFALEHLRAGDWELRAFAPGATFRDQSTSASRGPVAPRFDVRVEEGRTATVELFVADRRARLRGQLTLAGASPGAWTAHIEGERSRSEAQLAPDGSFELQAQAGVELRLRLISQDPAWRHLELQDRVALPVGSSPWSFDLRPGTMRGVAPALAALQRPTVLLHWQGAGALEGFASTPVAEDGSFGPLELPAGSLSVHPGTVSRWKLEGAQPLLRAHLREGERLDLRVP